MSNLADTIKVKRLELGDNLDYSPSPLITSEEKKIYQFITSGSTFSQGVEIVDTSSDKIISEGFLTKKGFVTHEHWANTTNYHARIFKVTDKQVYCDCLIDAELGIFEARKFPIVLFNCLDQILEGKFVFIQIKTKPGSTRIDVFNGEHLVDKKIFEIKDKLSRTRDYASLEEKI